MSGWRRWLLMCVLCLALPLQGLAAAAQWHCGSAAGDTPAAVYASGHAAEADAHVHAGHDTAGTHDDASPHASDGAGRCSVCVSCCTSALPVAALQPLPAEPPAAFTPDRRHALVPAFETGGPERPPRQPLA